MRDGKIDSVNSLQIRSQEKLSGIRQSKVTKGPVLAGLGGRGLKPGSHLSEEY